METPSSEIVGRIQKLLRLARGAGATEAEASAALAKANELLLRYNLSVDAVAAERQDMRPAKVEEDQIKLGRRDSWQHRLLIALATHNFCSPFYSGEYVVFVGRSTNVAVTREMFNWIAPQVESIGDAEWASFSRDPDNTALTSDPSWCPDCEEGSWRQPGRACPSCGVRLIAPRVHGKTWKTNFYRGLLQRISRRQYEERKKLENAETTTPKPSQIDSSMALAIRNLQLATRAENDTYIVRHHGKLHSRRTSSSRSDSGAYSRGQAAGDRVSLRGHRLGSGTTGALPPA